MKEKSMNESFDEYIKLSFFFIKEESTVRIDDGSR